jgi:TIR domain
VTSSGRSVGAVPGAREDRYFLSYARADGPFALRLAGDLRAAGVDVWVDQLDILPSQRWDRALEAALRASAGILVILSPRSVASENVMDEVGFAIDQRKDVIPVLHEPCDIPIRISRFQHVDFTRDYAAALERCKSVFGALSPRAKAPQEDPAHAQARPNREWSAELLLRAEQDLMMHVGPIAEKLVQAAARQANNAAELYQSLAGRIPNAAARAAFLKGAPGAADEAGAAPSATHDAPAAGTFSRSLLDAVILELIRYLGPISRLVVEHASREASDADDLYVRVSNRVADAEDRAALLKRLRALP